MAKHKEPVQLKKQDSFLKRFFTGMFFGTPFKGPSSRECFEAAAELHRAVREAESGVTAANKAYEEMLRHTK